MMRGLIRLALVVFVYACATAGVARADQDVAPVATAYGCQEYLICDAEANTGACKNAGGTEVLVATMNATNVSFNAQRSTASAFSCNVYENRDRYSATVRTQLLSTGLSESQLTVKWPGTNGLLTKVWAECASIADNAVTVTATVCR